MSQLAFSLDILAQIISPPFCINVIEEKAEETSASSFLRKLICQSLGFLIKNKNDPDGIYEENKKLQFNRHLVPTCLMLVATQILETEDNPMFKQFECTKFFSHVVKIHTMYQMQTLIEDKQFSKSITSAVFFTLRILQVTSLTKKDKFDSQENL